jgi:hypothetical protein
MLPPFFGQRKNLPSRPDAITPAILPERTKSSEEYQATTLFFFRKNSLCAAPLYRHLVFCGVECKTAAPSIWNLSSAIASRGAADDAPGG